MTECKHTMGHVGGYRCMNCGKSDKEIVKERNLVQAAAAMDKVYAEHYERMFTAMTLSNAPSLAPKAQLDNYDYRIKSYPYMFPTPPMIKVHHLDTSATKCVWCASEGPGVCTRVLCERYDSALKERIAAGAYDIPEERDAVRRWINAQIDSQLAKSICDTCKRTPPKRGYSRCLDCMAPPSRKAQPVAPPENLIVWSTATDES